MIEWIYFPKSDEPPSIAKSVVEAFTNVSEKIDSQRHDLQSNDVLAKVGPGLSAKGFKVESGKKSNQRIFVPVLFGRNGKPENHLMPMPIMWRRRWLLKWRPDEVS